MSNNLLIKFAAVLCLVLSASASAQDGLGVDPRLSQIANEDRAYIAAMVKSKGVLPVKAISQLAVGDVCRIALYDREKKVSQIIDGSNLTIGSNSIWLEGLGTSSIGENELIDVSSVCFYFAGNRQYTTVLGGKKTVKHLIAVGSDTANDIIGEKLHEEGIELVRNVAGKLIGTGKVVRKSKTKIQIKGEGKAVYRLNVSDIYPRDAQRIIGDL